MQHLTDPDELHRFVSENVSSLLEEEAVAVLENRHITAPILSTIAQNPRLTGFYSVRLRLVAHRQTPQAHAVKLVHYLYWFDLLRLSVDVKVPATVRRAIDTQMLLRAPKLSLGEKVASAPGCSPALIKVFLFDPHPRVFAALLVNKRLREDDLLSLIATNRATREQLVLIAEDRKWSYRHSIRRALVLNPATPRSTAASQLRHLSRKDLREILSNPATTVYVRRCIERMLG